MRISMADKSHQYSSNHRDSSIYKPPYEIVTGDLLSENSCLVKMVIESMNFQKCRNSFCEMKYLRYRGKAPKEYRKYAFHQFSTGILKLQCDSQLHLSLLCQ